MDDDDYTPEDGTPVVWLDPHNRHHPVSVGIRRGNTTPSLSLTWGEVEAIRDAMTVTIEARA